MAPSKTSQPDPERTGAARATGRPARRQHCERRAASRSASAYQGDWWCPRRPGSMTATADTRSPTRTAWRCRARTPRASPGSACQRQPAGKADAAVRLRAETTHGRAQVPGHPQRAAHPPPSALTVMTVADVGRPARARLERRARPDRLRQPANRIVHPAGDAGPKPARVAGCFDEIQPPAARSSARDRRDGGADVLPLSRRRTR